MNKILVIGNGFDLAHKLPTSYSDFLHYIKSKLMEFDKSKPTDVTMREFMDIVNCNGFVKYFLEYTEVVPMWVDLERLLQLIIGEIEWFINNLDGCRHGNVFIESRMSNNLINILRWFGISKKETIQRLYLNNNFSNVKVFYLNERFYNNIYGMNTRELKEELRGHLEGLIRVLQIYLYEHISLKSTEIQEKKQIKEINPSYIISFNYTDTYKIYGIKNADVFHVHGCLEKGNMVLGFDDNNPMQSVPSP